MAKEYEVEVTVRHVVFVVADDAEEAEELAYDAFIDDEDRWDDVDTVIIYATEV